MLLINSLNIRSLYHLAPYFFFFFAWAEAGSFGFAADSGEFTLALGDWAAAFELDVAVSLLYIKFWIL